jgi:dihydrofolate synthase/folylpolyglutamate synthase
MTYQETLAFIYGLGRFGMRPGLERITALLNAIGNPQDHIRSVHVAGTNGKGSTAAFIASIMECAGYRIGLFTSPHLIRFTERIRINGEEISPDEVTRIANRLLEAACPETTFFELVTAMALSYFAERDVDLAVMEVGMGGRLDATNAAAGLLSVITPISMEHCEYLGDSLKGIAYEKAGIIKSGRPVVTSTRSPEALEVIQMESERLSSPLYRFGNEFSATWEADGLSYRGIKTSMRGLIPGPAGRYQGMNAAAALAAAELLGGMGFKVADSSLRGGIETSSWPGRMEMIGESPRILLDGAHNPAASLALVEELREVPRDRLLLIAGIMADKDVEGVFNPLFSMADLIFAVSPAVERAMESGRLAALCRLAGASCVDAGTVAEGLSRAQKEARPEDLILVCGSLFAVGEARALLCRKRFEPFRG